MQVHDLMRTSTLRRTFITSALLLGALGALLTIQRTPAQAATAIDAPLHIAPLSLPHGTSSRAGFATTTTAADRCAITGPNVAAEHYVLSLLNRHRAAAGVRPLTLNGAISQVSRAHSCDMAMHGWLSHNGSDGSTFAGRLTATGVPFDSAAENIGESSGGEAGIASIDAMMMAEPLTPGDHHWNIIDPASTQVGIGVVVARGVVWFTEDFSG